MSQQSDLNRVIKNAEAQGFRYFKSTSGHHQLYAPNGHDIVTTSGTPSDHRSFNNFMADLRRAGYMELQTLGDVMPRTTVTEEASKEPEDNKMTKLSATKLILDLLSRYPEGKSSCDIGAYVHSIRSELGRTSHTNALTQLSRKEMIIKEQGLYRLSKNKGNGATPIVTPHVAPSAAGMKTGDASIDKDLKALDTALAALASIESVVRKNREVLVQFAKLKAMLK